MHEPARSHAYEDITTGLSSERRYVITEQVYLGFLDTFGDKSPIHVSDEEGRRRGFDRKVMQGAILCGFVSHFIGMHFPGEHALLQSMQIEFKTPSYLDDELCLHAEVTQKVESLRVLVLALSVRNLTQDRLAAKAKVQVGMQ